MLKTISLSANLTKWPNIQTIRRQNQTNCLSVFDHFVGLALKRLWSKFQYSRIVRVEQDIK